jgi:hypothetical protein
MEASSKYKLTTIIPSSFAVLILLFLARNHICAQVLPGGDLAADMLLANQITEKSYLLTGQYSRFGFHHPGPFFFYIYHLFEILLRHTMLSRYGIWALATAILNALFLAIAATLAIRYRPGMNINVIIARTIFIILVLSIVQDYSISMWAPDKTILPYLAFLLTLPSIAKREYQYLRLSVLLACILIHSYITLILFVLPCLSAAAIWGFFSVRRPLAKKEIGLIIGGEAIALSFASPIIIDVIINRPSNLKKI